jgi:hypothetical protein
MMAIFRHSIKFTAKSWGEKQEPYSIIYSIPSKDVNANRFIPYYADGNFLAGFLFLKEGNSYLKFEF